MGTISLEHSDRLYWLGRYTERFFTTLKALGKQFDKMIGTAHSYTDYLDCFGLPDIYSDNSDFIRSLLFDENSAHSAAYSLERAYDTDLKGMIPVCEIVASIPLAVNENLNI